MRHALIRMSSKSGLHNACRYLYRLAAIPIVVVLVMYFQQARTNAFGVFLPITAELGHPISVEMTYKFLRANAVDDDARHKHCIPKTDSAMANARKARLCATSRPADNMQSMRYLLPRLLLAHHVESYCRLSSKLLSSPAMQLRRAARCK